MQTPYDTRLPPHLRSLKQEIEGYARGYGLDFYETIFEVIDADDLNEVAAYGGFPTRYPHWSFGMSYEELRRGYDYGLSKIYELVINNDPCYAYLMRSNHVVDQKLVMAHVYGHCLAPETRIETREGIKAIADVRVGDEVLTHTGAYRGVRVCARRWFRGKIQRLRIAGSNEMVRITGEHPVYVLRPASCVVAGRQTVPCRPTCQMQHKCSSPRPYTEYQLEWTPAADVREGDVVAFPRRKSEGTPFDSFDIPFDKVLHRQRLVGRRQMTLDSDLAKLIGYFIAEGNAQPRGVVGFGFHADEVAFQAETSALASRLFGVNIGRDDYRDSHATTIRFNSLEIAAWLGEQAGTHSYNKRIPQFLMDCGRDEVLVACLQGLFNGDGYYTKNPGRASGTLSVTTTSETLAYQLRHVCLRWDIRSSIMRRQRKGRQPSYEVIWTGKSAHKLSQLLYGEDVIEGNRSFERSWSDSDFLYQHIRTVETEDYDGPVYNFSVEEDESYTLAAGFIVHNCDFFKNNAYFGHTNRKMMDEMANHGARIRSYVEKYGEDEVEAFVDRCMSIDDLIDIHSTAIRRRKDVSRYDFTPESEQQEDVRATRFKSKDYMDAYINPQDVLKAEEDQRRKQKEQVARSFPEAPEKDVLLFLIEYAPPLKTWQRDVLSIIRDEAYYFTPQGQTKVINEGWASFWHSTIMTQKALAPSEVIDYADHHSGTMAMQRTRLNPYKLGIELLRDIEQRWNTGRFGKEYDECDDLDKKRTWDKQLGLGREKIFEVRRVHNDITFIDTFLTPEFCVQHGLFSFAYQEQAGQFIIESREFEKIKQRLLFSLTNFGKPWIYVIDGNHRNRGELLLKHQHNGVELRLDQAADTLANIQFIWGRPVHLHTVVDGKPTTLSFDGTDHSIKTGGDNDDNRGKPPAKTR